MVKTRSQARHILAMMLRHISSFFQNANLLDVPNHQDAQESFFFHERVYNLHRLLQLALHLTELLYAQLSLSRHLMDNLRSSLNSVTRLQSLLRHRQASSSNTSSISPQGHSRLLQVPTFRPSSRTPILLTRESSVPISVLSADAVASSSSNAAASGSGGGVLPQVHLNDVPLPSPPSSPPSYPARSGGSSNARFLHPRHVNMFDEGSEEPTSERGGAGTGGLGSNVFLMRGAYGPNSILVPDSYYSPHHRIQAWDFARSNIPDIWNAQKNVVVKECKIHNDASVDISKDGQILVTLLPSGRLSVTTMLGVYSLHWSTLGQCLYTTSFELNAVSVSLSPTSRHLIVGLASRRVSLSSFTDTHTIAQIFRLEGGVPGTTAADTNASSGSSPTDPKDPSPTPNTSSGGKKGRLVRLRHIELPRDTGYMSLNCIRWAPNPGQGLVYGTNTGLLRILE
uniref:Activating molecule in BECN1-regulated autophagy protein 1 n=1 Tax=Cacopsylla melanoneura TaxID=428564 RepID=A0A8D8UE64_9HEMI